MKRMQHVAVLSFLLLGCVGLAARDARSLIRSQPATIEIDRDLMRSIAVNRDAELVVTLPVDGTNITLTLRRHDVLPITSRTIVQTDRGPVRFDTRQIVAYRGSIPGVKNSIVSIVITPNEVIGTIDAGGRRTVIGPDRTRTNAFVAATIDASDATSKVPCKTPDNDISEQALRAMREAPSKPLEDVQANDTLIMQLAIECDYLYFTGMKNNMSQATAYIVNLFSMTSQIFERDLQTRLTLSFIRVWDTPNDPYDDVLRGHELVKPFRDYYRVNMDTVQRDLAVFMTMRRSQSGVAGSIGGLCNDSGSYAALDALGDAKPLPTFSFDVLMAAHELGHVCGGLHTQSCLWPGGPLDSCVPSEDGDCVPYEKTKATYGTIMSYCHQNDEGVELVFHPRSKAALRFIIERASCVGARAPSQTNVLTGRLLDAKTKQPIVGVRLTISPYAEEVIYDQAPILGDSVSVTDGDGRYRFDGIGNEFVHIRLPWTLSPYPLEFYSYENAVIVMVTESITELDIMAVPTQPIVIDLRADTMPERVTVYVVSDRLPEFYKKLTLSKFVLENYSPLTFGVPPGNWSIIPVGRGITFQPETLNVVVPQDGPANVTPITMSPSRPNVTYQTVGLTLFEHEDGVTEIAPNEKAKIVDFQVPPSEVLLQSNENGVVFASGLDDTLDYEIYALWDTTQYTDADFNGGYASSSYVEFSVFKKRLRRFPLSVRPYELSILPGTWTPIENGTTVMSGRALTMQQVALPFPLRVGDRTYDSLWIHEAGHVTGGMPGGGRMSNIIAPYRTDFMAVPLSGYIFLRSGSQPGTVRTIVRGSAPSRTFVIEWRRLHTNLYSQATGAYQTGDLNVQLHIHERTGIIDFVYGPIDFLYNSDTMGITVGLRGNDNLDFQNVQSAGAIGNWSNLVSRTAPPTAVAFLSNAGKPALGTTLRFANPATSVDETTESELHVTITAHPTSESARITWSAALGQASTISIVDLLGRTVSRVSDHSVTSPPTGTVNSITIDLSKLASGTYNVIVQTPTASVGGPLIIQR